MAEKEFTGTKFELFINLLKQPSTTKGILGLIAVVATRFGMKDFLSPEDYSMFVEGIATIYFLIAIFWQKN